MSRHAHFREGNRAIIQGIRDQNGKLFTDLIEKANSLNSYYASLISCDNNNLQIQSPQSGKSFTISINILRKQLSGIGRKKCVGTDGIAGEILKLFKEAMIPYPARLLDIAMNNSAIPGDRKKTIMVTL